MPLLKHPRKLAFQRFTAGSVAVFALLTAQVKAEEVNFGEIAQRVSNMLAAEHFKQEPFDDAMSQISLDMYLEMLDPARRYFLQGDIDSFQEKYATQIDDQVQLENIGAAYDIFGIYKKRVQDRYDYIKHILETEDFTFDSNRTVQRTRKNAAWMKTSEEADDLWHRIIESELLQEVLRDEAEVREAAEKASSDEEKLLNSPPAAPGAPKQPETPAANPAPNNEPKTPDEASTSPEKDDSRQKLVLDVTKPEDKLKLAQKDEKDQTPQERVIERYERFWESVKENDVDDIAVLFIKAISHAYDPHSDYFSQSQYDNFRIGMNKSLTGIGAILSMDENGYAEIQGLVVGGPAHLSGNLKVNDRISGVAQGPEGEMADIVHEKLQDVVELIRGKEGSTVRLRIVPGEGSESTTTKEVSIVRDKVDLKESLASAELIETKDDNGNDLRLGWINLLSFYSDMEGGDVSTTADVERLLNKLTEENLDGLVLDLRDNGGGSLEEAINLTGLFIPRGPVVQSKDWRGNIDAKFSRNHHPKYEGPFIVLTNRSSASASEIVAAALQDYSRAIIVGEKSTFGKGTVQQLRPVQSGRPSFFPYRLSGPDNGALKLTIQKFYRIAGGSTQLKGVIPDIVLPSPTDPHEIGEEALSNPLKYDEIPPQTYGLAWQGELPIEELTRLSSKRIGQSQEFAYILEDRLREQERIEKNEISLNHDVRETERESLEEIRDSREAERRARFAKILEEQKGRYTIYSITQDNVAEEGYRLKSEISREESTGIIAADNPEEGSDDRLEYPFGFDPYKLETINIMKDFIRIDQTQRRGKITGNQEFRPQP